MKSRHLIIVLLLLASCGTYVRSFSDFDPDYNILEYKSFDWAKTSNIEGGNNPIYYNELNDKRIKSAVMEQMSSRGFLLLEDKPDLIVHYHIVLENQSAISTEPFNDKYGPYWTNGNANIYAYREGTLIVDLMDYKTNALVWRGGAVSAIEGGYTSKEIEHLIHTAVAKMFKKFPRKSRNQ